MAAFTVMGYIKLPGSFLGSGGVDQARISPHHLPYYTHIEVPLLYYLPQAPVQSDSTHSMCSPRCIVVGSWWFLRQMQSLKV